MRTEQHMPRKTEKLEINTAEFINTLCCHRIGEKDDNRQIR